jgi:hypothetical protein
MSIMRAEVVSERKQEPFSEVTDVVGGLARMFDRITSNPEILGGKPIIRAGEKGTFCFAVA